MKRILCMTVLLIFLGRTAMGGDLQLNAGATSTTYDDAPDANSWGVSVRAQYNFTSNGSSWMVNYYGPAISAFAGELSGGYLLKSSGDFYLEGGLGASYSTIRGPGPLIVAGFGVKVGNSVYLDFPVTLTYALVLVPYIGISF